MQVWPHVSTAVTVSLARLSWSRAKLTTRIGTPVFSIGWVPEGSLAEYLLSGPLACSDSRILALGLGPETFDIRPRRAGFQPSGPGETFVFLLEESTTSAPGWRAGWGTSFGTLRVSR